ncbi:hypothetical protein JTB14_011829 [Gonioctena quinquepunctata]|nr:hypothetical protein JTB14_011829 [Gonioctena quinquepunctata]
MGNIEKLTHLKIETKHSGFVLSAEVDTPSKVLKKRGRPRKNLEKMKIEQTKEVVDLQIEDTASENKKSVDVNIESNETEKTHYGSDMEQEYLFPEKVNKSKVKVDQMETKHRKNRGRPRNNAANEEEQLNNTSSDINESDNNHSDKQVSTSILASDCLLQVTKERGRSRKNLEKMNIDSTKEVIGVQQNQGIHSNLESDLKQEVSLFEEVDASTKTKVDQMKVEVNKPEIEKKLSGFVSSVEVDTSLKISKKRGRPRKNLEKMKIEQAKEVVELKIVDIASENKKCVDVHIESNKNETTHSRSDMEQEFPFLEKVDESTKVDQMETEHIEEPSSSTEHLSTPKVKKRGRPRNNTPNEKEQLINTFPSDINKSNNNHSDKQFSTPILASDCSLQVIKKRGRSRKNIGKINIDSTKEVIGLHQKQGIDSNIESDLKQEVSLLEKVDGSTKTKVDQMKTGHIEVNTPEIEKELSGFVSSVEVDTSLKVSKKRGRPRKNLEKMKIEQAKEVVDLHIVDTSSENKKCVDVHIESNETETTHSRSDMEQEYSFPEKVDESTKVDRMETEHIEAPSFSTEHLSTPKVKKRGRPRNDTPNEGEQLINTFSSDINKSDNNHSDKQCSTPILASDCSLQVIKKEKIKKKY